MVPYKLGWVGVGKHDCEPMPLGVWNACDKLLRDGMMSGDVYEINSTFYVIVAWGRSSNFAVVLPENSPAVIVPLDWDEVNDIPGMPQSWDIPF